MFVFKLYDSLWKEKEKKNEKLQIHLIFLLSTNHFSVFVLHNYRQKRIICFIVTMCLLKVIYSRCNYFFCPPSNYFKFPIVICMAKKEKKNQFFFLNNYMTFRDA